MWKKNIDNVIKVQKEGSKLFDDSGGQVLYEYATGVGKSKQAIDNILKDNEWWVILCWETAHIENWKNEFKQWNQGHLVEGDKMRVHLICYASLKNYFAKVDSNYKINIVCDEAHHMFSPTFFPYVVRHAKKLQMLTATLPVEFTISMQNHPRLSKVARKVVSLNQAIKMNILPSPAIYIVPISFNSLDRNQTIHITRGVKDKWQKQTEIHVNYSEFKKYMKQNPLNMIVHCTESELMQYHNNQVDFYRLRYMHGKEFYIENQMKQAGMKRKRFIAEVKTTKAKKFIDEFIKDSRSIIFCGSVEQAIELGSDCSVHSHNTAKVNKQRIEDFQSGKTSRLYTNRMLREGMNLKNIEKAVIIQLDNKNLAFVQMAGRAMRSDFPELFIFHAPLSQDDKYLNNSLKGINKDFIKSIDAYGEVQAPASNDEKDLSNLIMLGLK